MNQAAELGPHSVPWWLDWRGECCAIIASGPSINKQEVAALENRIHCVAIKSNIDIAPWSDAVYGCDNHWWVHRQGLPKFKGVKLTYGTGISWPDVHHIDINRGTDALLIDKPGVVGNGGNSGFQALNLAVQFGATGILLLGFDMMQRGNSPHWYGRNEWPGASNPNDSNYNRWRKAFTQSKSTLDALGVDVVNASTLSTLDVFRKATIDQALRGWGL